MKISAKKASSWHYGLLPAVLAVLLFANTIPNKYCLDDYCVIVNNSYVQEGVQGIPKLISTNFFNGFNGFNDGLYRPVPMVTYAIEFSLFGLNPHVSHLVNLLFFAFSGFILFLLMKRLMGSTNIMLPLAIALLYVAHPVHTEAVANIKGRDDLLAFFFGILAMLWFLKYAEAPSAATLLTGLGFYILSLLSKESSLMFLFVIPLMVFLFSKSNRATWLKAGVLLIGITAGWLVLRYAVIHSMPNPVDRGIFSSLNNSILSTNDLVSRIATGLYLQSLYILKMIFPYPLSHDYSFNQIPPIGIFSARFLVTIVMLVSILVALYYSFRKNKLIFFGILFYFLTIATVSNIVLYIGATFAERFLLTPSLGFSMVTGALLALLLKDVRVQETLPRVLSGNKVYAVVLTAILLVYAAGTIARNTDWKDNLTLYSADVNSSPGSARARYNLGSELMARAGGEQDELRKAELLRTAALELNLAVAIFPYYLDAFNNLGNVYAALGSRDSAARFYAQAIRLDSNYMKGYYNLGVNYYAMGRFADAIPLLLRYAEFRPETPQLFYYIGNAYGSLGQFDQAILYLEKNITIRGDEIETLLLLGKAYGLKGQLDRSLEIFNRALKIDGNNGDALLNIGMTYRFLGEPLKSIVYLEKAVQLAPGSLPALTELAGAYDAVHRQADAATIRGRIAQAQNTH